MSWRLANSLITLRDQLNQLYPNRNKASDGTIGDAAHAGTVSEHNPNAAGVVTAIDITHDPANGLDIQQLANNLSSSGDSRIWYIIANKRIWEAGQWYPYTGADSHTSHIHISTNQTASQYDNSAMWKLNIQGDDEMIENNYSEFERAKLATRDIRGGPAADRFTRDYFNMNVAGKMSWRSFLDNLMHNPEAEYRQHAGDVGKLAIEQDWWNRLLAKGGTKDDSKIAAAIKEAKEALASVEALK
jgi:hypothetical protein